MVIVHSYVAVYQRVTPNQNPPPQNFGRTFAFALAKGARRRPPTPGNSNESAEAGNFFCTWGDSQFLCLMTGGLLMTPKLW